MCNKCEEYGGRWQMTDAGLKRCDCPGNDAVRKLAVMAENPKCNPPNLTAEQAVVFVESLAVMPFFPAESGARTAIGEEIRAICEGPIEAHWLVTRMRRLYRRWPGTLDMRHVYASRYLPWDGLLPVGESEAYPGGIPTEGEQRVKGLPEPAMKALPDIGIPISAASPVSASPTVVAAVRRLVAAKDLNRTEKPPRVPDVPLVNVPPEKRITAADVEREVDRQREERGRRELGGAQ